MFLYQFDVHCELLCAFMSVFVCTITFFVTAKTKFCGNSKVMFECKCTFKLIAIFRSRVTACKIESKGYVWLNNLSSGQIFKIVKSLAEYSSLQFYLRMWSQLDCGVLRIYGKLRYVTVLVIE